MLWRTLAIMVNSYREALRARVLHGLFALALLTAGYCSVVGQYVSPSAGRVLSDLGAASVSVYGVVVAIVLSATALHRELEHKTLFPILTRPLARSEYLVGKFLGTLTTLVLFITANTAVFLAALAASSGRPLWQPLAALALAIGLAGATLGWLRRLDTALVGAIAASAAVGCYALASGAPEDRTVLVVGAMLVVEEVAVVSALALVFSSFSSPFLTAVSTLGVFLVGRSAQTLGQLPARVFGEPIHRAGQWLSHVAPNLMLYVPDRALILQAEASPPLSEYLAFGLLQCVGWCVGLLLLGSVVFSRRELA